MPNDLFRWEEGGGLVHHCPVCQTPLSHAKAKRICLGNHVEWCSRYHCQLFCKGRSAECAPCRHSEEQHAKRHRDIAVLVHQYKDLERTTVPMPEAPPTPGTPKQSQLTDGSTPTSMTKKERKLAKKAVKIANVPKVVSSIDVTFVANTLHPKRLDELEPDRVGPGRTLSDDPEIKLNRFFHKGTSNLRSIRQEFLVKPREEKQEPEVSPAEVDRILENLGIDNTSSAASDKTNDLIAAIRLAIEADLLNIEKEQQQIKMRKAGFWRWANRKAYDRTVEDANTKNEEGLGSSPKEHDDLSTMSGLVSPQFGSSKAMESSKTEPTAALPLNRGRPPFESSLQTLAEDVNSSSEDGWTPVGRKTLKVNGKPVGKITFAANGGLAKLQVIPKAKLDLLDWQHDDQ